MGVVIHHNVSLYFFLFADLIRQVLINTGFYTLSGLVYCLLWMQFENAPYLLLRASGLLRLFSWLLCLLGILYVLTAVILWLLENFLSGFAAAGGLGLFIYIAAQMIPVGYRVQRKPPDAAHWLQHLFIGVCIGLLVLYKVING